MSDAVNSRKGFANLLSRYADHPSAFLAVNRETKQFTSPVSKGFIAYRPRGDFLYQIGNVFAPTDKQPALLDDFRAFAQEQNKRICAIQIREADIPMYQEAGFRINQLGLSYTIDLKKFTLAGTPFQKLRNKISRARRAKVEVIELKSALPDSDQYEKQMETVTSDWLKSKGPGKKLLQFMVGEYGDELDSMRRIFIGVKDERVVGFITYVPSYGTLPGVMHDLSRRIHDAPPGALELINSTAIQRFIDEEVPYLHFGHTPCVGIAEETDKYVGRSNAVAWVLNLIAERGHVIYPAKSQVKYKLKWNPQIISPEYVAFEEKFSLSLVWSLLRLTNAI